MASHTHINATILAHHLYDFAECEHRIALDVTLDKSLRTPPDAAMELLFEPSVGSSVRSSSRWAMRRRCAARRLGCGVRAHGPTDARGRLRDRSGVLLRKRSPGAAGFVERVEAVAAGRFSLQARRREDGAIDAKRCGAAGGVRGARARERSRRAPARVFSFWATAARRARSRGDPVHRRRRGRARGVGGER